MRALGVLVPAGPGDDVVDTVESVLHYTSEHVEVIVVDDTHDGRTAGRLGRLGPRVEVVIAPAWAPGGFGGLWVKICSGLRRWHEKGTPQAVVRMDADALCTGPGLEEVVADALTAFPGAGVLGSVWTGPHGGTRDLAPAVALYRLDTRLRAPRHPRLAVKLLRLRRSAAAHGAPAGLHALGGACILRGDFVDHLAGSGELELGLYRHSRMGEDHICGLLAAAAGYSLADVCGPGSRLAVEWRGLPFPPEEIVRRNVCLTHSVRSWQSMDEAQIRRWFADRRRAEEVRA